MSPSNHSLRRLPSGAQEWLTATRYSESTKNVEFGCKVCMNAIQSRFLMPPNRYKHPDKGGAFHWGNLHKDLIRSVRKHPTTNIHIHAVRLAKNAKEESEVPQDECANQRKLNPFMPPNPRSWSSAIRAMFVSIGECLQYWWLSGVDGFSFRVRTGVMSPTWFTNCW